MREKAIRNAERRVQLPVCAYDTDIIGLTSRILNLLSPDLIRKRISLVVNDLF